MNSAQFVNNEEGKAVWIWKVRLGLRILLKCPELIPYLLPDGLRKLFAPSPRLWE